MDSVMLSSSNCVLLFILIDKALYKRTLNLEL